MVKCTCFNVLTEEEGGGGRTDLVGKDEGAACHVVWVGCDAAYQLEHGGDPCKHRHPPLSLFTTERSRPTHAAEELCKCVLEALIAFSPATLRRAPLDPSQRS